MRWLMTFFLLAGGFACGPQANSQSAPRPAPDSSTPPPAGWVSYPTPPADGPELRCANYSAREWRVEPNAGGVKITLNTEPDRRDPLPPGVSFAGVAVNPKGTRRVMRVEDGWLVGLDAGEFGGSLWWFGPNGQDRKRLAVVNVVGFAKISGAALALVGLSHMGDESGKVLRLERAAAGGGWKAEVLADLGATPRAFAADTPGALLVLTTRGLARVRASGAVEQLFQTPNYKSLYPNSMTLAPSGVIHVGMRHFVTRLTPSGNSYREEWFVPADCTRFGIRDYHCMCVSSRK